MNDVFESIYLRRSVRDYKPNDVPDDISTVSLVSNSHVNNLQPSIPIIITHELSDRSA
jgi:hypothetical protein